MTFSVACLLLLGSCYLEAAGGPTYVSGSQIESRWRGDLGISVGFRFYLGSELVRLSTGPTLRGLGWKSRAGTFVAPVGLTADGGIRLARSGANTLRLSARLNWRYRGVTFEPVGMNLDDPPYIASSVAYGGELGVLLDRRVFYLGVGPSLAYARARNDSLFEEESHWLVGGRVHFGMHGNPLPFLDELVPLLLLCSAVPAHTSCHKCSLEPSHPDCPPPRSRQAN